MSAPSSLPEWLAWMESHHPRGIELGLERVARVARRLGIDPGGARVVTVAGTNGKGSCVAALEAGLLAAGQRVGCYTSPHLLQYNERVRINGHDASDAALCAAFERVYAVLEDTSLTYFEFGTLAALLLFAAAELDVWVLEVGLGGRLDAVNLLDADIAVITSIDLDHQDWLGSSRDSIAAEKVGIARVGRPLVVAEADPPAVIVERARVIEAPLYRIGDAFDLKASAAMERLQWWVSDASGQQYEGDMPSARLPLPSLAAALQVLCLLQVAPSPVLLAALAAARLPARFQRARVEGVEVIVDVAHNPAAAALLARRLDGLPAVGRTCALFGVMADKDVEGMIDALGSRIDAWFLAELADLPRALPPSELAARIHARGHHMISVSRNLRQAWRRVLSLLGEGDRLVVFGSFHVAGPVLDWIKRDGKRRSAAAAGAAAADAEVADEGEEGEA